jgi:hypothetical protein
VFRAQRGVVRRHAARGRRDGPRRAAAVATRGSRPRPGARSAARGRLPAGAARAAGDDGRDRHAVLQLPGAAAVVREVHVARLGADLRAADDRDGPRLGPGRARRGSPQPRHAAAARRVGAAVRRGGARRGRRPHPARPGADPGAGRRSQRHLRSGRQLVAAARGVGPLARARDVAVLGGVPRLDADRRADRRLARPGLRTARGPRARRGRSPGDGRGRRLVPARSYAISYNRA